MRIQLIAIGSMGDVLPMLSLGKELSARGHAVSITAFSALRPMIEAAGLGYHELPGDAAVYIGNIIRPGANPLTYLTRLERSLRDVADPFFTGMLSAFQHADAVVATFFGATPYALSEAFQVPLFQTSYCLTDTTGEYCLPVLRQPPLGPAFNRATYRLAYEMIGMLEKRYVKPWCMANGIPPRNMSKGPDYAVGGQTVPVLYAFSEHVVPRPREWPQNLHLTGFWEEVSDFTPGDDLAAFLAAGETPVYFGFGSMTSGDMGEALRTVLAALKETKLRAIISAGWGGMANAALPENIYVVRDFIPHPWLFAQMRAVVHHGGAGTTAAGLMAGRPTLVVPFGSDQHFWGDRIHALGCGPKPLLRARMTAARLAASLQETIDNPVYLQNAKAVQEKLLQENGAKNAADIIEAHLARR